MKEMYKFMKRIVLLLDYSPLFPQLEYITLDCCLVKTRKIRISVYHDWNCKDDAKDKIKFFYKFDKFDLRSILINICIHLSMFCTGR